MTVVAYMRKLKTMLKRWYDGKERKVRTEEAGGLAGIAGGDGGRKDSNFSLPGR